MTLRRLRILACAAMLAALGSACGGAAAATCDPGDRLTLPVPPELGGLKVANEPELGKKLLSEGGKNTYACDASVFSLRKGKELRAVFEVVRLSIDARPEDVEFRRKIVDAIGGTSRKPEKFGQTLVYTARTNQQVFLIWFLEDTRFMEVLVVRENPAQKGRASDVDAVALLNEILQLKPVAA